MQVVDQLRLFAECLFDPNDIVEIRMIRIDPKGASSLWVLGSTLATECTLASWNRTHDIYVGANPRKMTGRRTNEGVELARCVFVDWDEVSIADAAHRIDAAGLPVPTCVVWSGGGVHAYWRLETPIIDMELWRNLQRQMILLLGSDRTIHDPARIMRLPGFFNHKPGRTNSCLVYANPSHRVNINELASRCQPLEQLPTSHRSNYVMPCARSHLLKRAAAYLSRIPAAISGNHGHNQTFRAAAILVKFGLTEEEAMGILHEYNERCSPPWQEKDLRRKYREAVKHKASTRTPA